MAVVMITLSSDSESESEVEIVGSYSNKNEILPLSSVRVEVNDLNITVPVPCIDLTHPRSTHAERNKVSRYDPVCLEVVDLTEDKDLSCEDNQLQSEDCQIVELVADSQQQSSKVELPKKSPVNCGHVLEATKVCLKRGNLSSPKPSLTKMLPCNRSASVKLRRLSIIENNLKELLNRVCVVNTQRMSLHYKKGGSEEGVCPKLSNTTTIEGYKPLTEAPLDNSCQEKATGHCSQADNIHLEHQIPHPTFTQDTEELSTIPSSACASSSGKPQFSFPKESRSASPSLPIGTSTVHLPLCKSRSHSLAHLTTVSSEDSLLKASPKCELLKSIKVPKPQSDTMTFDKASESCSQTPQGSPSVCRTNNLDKDFFTCENEFEDNSAELFILGGKDDMNESFELSSISTSKEDKYYVCSTAAKNVLHRGPKRLTGEQDSTRKPQILCRQSLSLVYSTIDESYQEGTLQLLSDLLVPGYYPPKDIIAHLLWGILLNPQSPHHNCVHAFDLLMRTQRYHIADKWSVPWDWEKLSFVMEKQENLPEILYMFLEYVTQTLEDDFKAKQATLAPHQSIAKGMLSFDQFSHIRDICKWLFSAIVKSTDCIGMGTEHIRIVAILQRLLSLALEVDCSPAISSARLSQELFHMLISSAILRSQRMMLLESLQSKLLMCKLLEHLLDYSCPVKTSVPMSLSLLLHFLNYCMLPLDPKDGTDKWRRWEELVCLLWMLLLSYNTAMKGYLCGAKTERRLRVGPSVYKPEDMVSKCAVREAVEAFLSRSKKDIGEALPLHVEESLTYLQDHLLDVCQC